jgi:hypothetical protein
MFFTMLATITRHREPYLSPKDAGELRRTQLLATTSRGAETRAMPNVELVHAALDQLDTRLALHGQAEDVRADGLDPLLLALGDVGVEGLLAPDLVAGRA